jgi:hypothetical protein
MAQPLLEEPQAQKQYLRDFAAALSSQAAGLADENENHDSLLLEATNPAVRIEARFADGRLLISFTDLENLPGFSAQVRALSVSYCADMTREFIPVIEPMSRRLRFQRTLLLDGAGAVPSAQALAQDLSASLSLWYAEEEDADDPTGTAGGGLRL